jgi:NitT/TauT family transport system ATP-binding protein
MERSSTDPKIEIDEINKIYGEGTANPVQALQDINFDVYENEFVSIIGPSGCGKTTLLKCLGDIIEPTRGTIRIGGELAADARTNNDLSFFFQEDVLLPWRNVMDNVLLPLEIQGEDTSDPSVRQRAEEVIDTVGLGGFEESTPQQLSGGMRQRVALARGFVYDPEIFLMDEPFAALDALTRRKMNRELLRIHQEIQKTTVFVTHHITEAVWLSDRVVVLSPQPGEVHDIVDIDLARPRSEETRTLDAFVEYDETLTETVMQLDTS